MPVIKLCSRLGSGFTAIANDFIDIHMIAANGEYVKIYLCILRLADSTDTEWTLYTIADKLECTTRDVMKALDYWTQKGLMECEYDKDGQLISLILTNNSAASDPSGSMPASVSASETASGSASGTASGSVSERKASLSSKRVRELSSQAEVKELIQVASVYMGHPLNKHEAEVLLYFYDELGFSYDLTDYLLAYCAEMGHPDIAYIRKVGFNWYDEHVSTVEDARMSSLMHSADCRAIMKAFGLGRRQPAGDEPEYIKKWISTWGFSLEIIEAAIARTIKSIHEPSFNYTDSILKSWKEAGVSGPDDILRLDEERKSSSSRRKSSDKSGKSAGKNSSSQDNSGQNGRIYDYAALEKQLVGRR